LYKIVKALEMGDQWKDLDKISEKQKNEEKNNLVEFFENSPLYNSGINLERDRDPGREEEFNFIRVHGLNPTFKPPSRNAP